MATQNTDIVTAIQNNGKLLAKIQAALTSIVTALTTAFPAPLTGSTSWTPGAVANGAQATTTITITGVALGHFAQVATSVDLQGQTLTGYVSATNTVTVVLLNETGGPITLGAITVNARVI